MLPTCGTPPSHSPCQHLQTCFSLPSAAACPLIMFSCLTETSHQAFTATATAHVDQHPLGETCPLQPAESPTSLPRVQTPALQNQWRASPLQSRPCPAIAPLQNRLCLLNIAIELILLIHQRDRPLHRGSHTCTPGPRDRTQNPKTTRTMWFCPSPRKVNNKGHSCQVSRSSPSSF